MVVVLRVEMLLLLVIVVMVVMVVMVVTVVFDFRMVWEADILTYYPAIKKQQIRKHMQASYTCVCTLGWAQGPTLLIEVPGAILSTWMCT